MKNEHLNNESIDCSLHIFINNVNMLGGNEND